MLSTSKKILNAVLNDTKVMEDIEDFYLEYEDVEGSESDFSLVRGKESLETACPYKEGKKGQLDTKFLFNSIKEKYDIYKSEKMNVNVKK